jgi:hypothetical protein
MTVKELIECLELCQDDADVYIASPDRKKDYFLDAVRIESEGQGRSPGTIIFLDTSR